MALFILPGFITTRLADIVGVVHLISLTLIVTQMLKGRLQVQWRRVARAVAGAALGLIVLAGGARWYLRSVSLDYDLDDRLLSLSIPDAHDDVVVYRIREEAPERPKQQGSTLERLRADRIIRVGYDPDHLPYSYFNRQGELVGLDVEMMHRLAARLEARLEFVPYQYDTVAMQLDSGEIDAAIGGVLLNPDRLLHVGFTQEYQTATLSVVARDHRRDEFKNFDDLSRRKQLRLAVLHEDMARAARRRLPNIEFTVIDSYRSFFEGDAERLDGLVMPAEEGSAWNVLYPAYEVIVPHPPVRRPVAMAVRMDDVQWKGFLDGWLDFERLEGSLVQLRAYWVEGGGASRPSPRWCVVRDVLHWLP